MPDALPPEIEELRKRHDSLRTVQIQAQTNLENIHAELDRLKEQARTEFGTDDVDVLAERLAKLEAENLKARADYDVALKAIESKLAEIEKESQ